MVTALKPTGKDEFRDSAEQAFKRSAETVRDVAEKAGHNVREFIEDQSEKVSELRKTTEKSIVENPLKSVAIAALGGLVIGALLRR